jgi:hypothetical protein
MKIGRPSVTSSLPRPDALARPDPRLALRDAGRRPQERHDAVRELAGEHDGARGHRCNVDRHRLRRWPLRQVRRGTFAPEPVPYGRNVPPELRRRLPHVDPKRVVDGRVADPEPQDEAPAGRVGDERGALRTDVRVADVDVRDPRADGDAPGCRAHELRGGQHVVVHFGGEDRVESGVLRLARDRLHFAGGPANTGNDAESESFSHERLLSSAIVRAKLAEFDPLHLVAVRARRARHVGYEAHHVWDLGGRELSSTECLDVSLAPPPPRSSPDPARRQRTPDAPPDATSETFPPAKQNREPIPRASRSSSR